MSPLQWALLILGGVAIVALYVFSRRDRKAMDRVDPEGATEPLLPPPEKKQLDIFNSTDQQFDEFGVGKPRRIPPTFGSEFDAPGGEFEAEPMPAAAPKSTVKEKIVSLLIAEKNGVPISGEKIHRALAEANLEYGAQQIYHRMYDGEAIFSVAGLLKPGTLDPADADSLSTPGLTLFMVLPGPQRPAIALRDMLMTVEQLAKSLNAEIYDSKRKPFTQMTARTLSVEVDAWARVNEP